MILKNLFIYSSAVKYLPFYPFFSSFLVPTLQEYNIFQNE